MDELLDCCPDRASIGLTGQISVLSDQLFEGNGIEARSFTRKKQPAGPGPLSAVR